MIKEQRNELEHRKDWLRVMDHPEFSLSPSLAAAAADGAMKSSSPAGTVSNSRKRKHSYVELWVDDPLPSDWEQCKEEKLDLELSIMPAFLDKSVEKTIEKQIELEDGGMIAAVCLNCHLLVMLYCSSPFCPNCRHMQSLPTTEPLIKTLNLLN